MVWMAVHADMAVCLLNNSVHRGQAQPSAFADVLCSKEGFEDMALYLGRHAVSRVSHLQDRVARASRLIRLFTGQDFSGCFDGQDTAVWHGVTRVDREIQ